MLRMRSTGLPQSSGSSGGKGLCVPPILKSPSGSLGSSGTSGDVKASVPQESCAATLFPPALPTLFPPPSTKPSSSTVISLLVCTFASRSFITHGRPPGFTPIPSLPRGGLTGEVFRSLSRWQRENGTRGGVRVSRQQRGCLQECSGHILSGIFVAGCRSPSVHADMHFAGGGRRGWPALLAKEAHAWMP
jgi:hypothetical protein